jgi:hypothetical protein
MTYYRYNDGNFYSDYTDNNYNLELRTYNVIKETKCGVWIKFTKIGHWEDGKKFILEKYCGNTSTNKRFAWPTKELALISYIARKEKQVNILEYKLNNAKEFLAKAKEMQNEVS